MMQQIQARQRQHHRWFIALVLFSVAGLAVVAYVGYKVLTHSGIL